MTRAVSIIELEGYVINNVIENFQLLNCSDGSVKIRATLSNGEVVETKCISSREAARIQRMIMLYKRWNLKPA